MKIGTKKEQAYMMLKEMFLRRRFVPGTMLSENELARFLGMSRTPIREALQVLQSEGFVKVRPKQGIEFKGLSSTVQRETLELRAAIEGYVMAGCLPMKQEDILALKGLIEEQRRCCSEGDLKEYLRHDFAFHSYFFELYGNSMIMEVRRSINERFMSVGLEVLRDAVGIRDSFQGHLAIMEAVEAADVSKTLMAAHAHIEFGKRRLLSAVPLGVEEG
ncbi:MAG: GntR family transcriptional regulator [Fretibacterium sp.]|nr:GntR family transcriptional regulator [Fretibacterium sp.]